MRLQRPILKHLGKLCSCLILGVLILFLSCLSPTAARAEDSLYTRDIYFSFFMFTTGLKPEDLNYRQTQIDHMLELQSLGYTGFEFPIPPHTSDRSYGQELQDYIDLREAMDQQGLSEAKVATNVGATPTYDPSSADPEQQQAALEYLKSRVDITVALRGEILMGPIVIPYGAYPVEIDGQAVWSDALQDQLAIRYANAQPILQELGLYAEEKGVKLAIEPITHWETPGPNTLAQLLEFLEGVPSAQVGVVIDSSHEVLDGDGPEIFPEQVQTLAQAGRLHYAQVSPPDRGAVHTSWIPWQRIFEPILAVYDGPIAVEIFNAIPAFVEPLHLTRRKFWIPGEDEPNSYPSAYDIAEKAIEITRIELGKLVIEPEPSL